jgi:hypothetical protein
MNRYKITIPYSYLRYGDVTGYYNAESIDEAINDADAGDLEDEEHEDNDYSGENDYNYSEMEVELEEENIYGDEEENHGYTPIPKGPEVPAPYYLEEINNF